MGLPVEKRRYSIAEYLELEEESAYKNEFHDGEILAMAGGTENSSFVIVNLNTAVHTRLRGKPCRLYESNMRVRIARRASYVYPDAAVVCGGATFDAEDRNRTTILDPKVIFEVLSNSTESYDRGEKFTLYREIESLEEYVMISQNKPRIEVIQRQAGATWSFAHADGLDSTAILKSINIELPLREIYEGVDFAAAEPAA